MRSAPAVLAVFLSNLTLAAPASSPAPGKAAPAADKPRIQVAFKLDPRLSGPTYGGEHWVSPQTYRGASAQDTVEVRASAVDARGRLVKISPGWKVSDAEMVTVSPPRGDRVTIAVKRAGESSVTVAQDGTSRTLSVKATQTNGIVQVIISQ